MQYLALNRNDKVLDLFCGLGNFTLPAATLCRSAVGIEVNSLFWFFFSPPTFMQSTESTIDRKVNRAAWLS